MTFGTTPEGFNRKTSEDIQSSLESRAREKLDENIDTSSKSPLGQLIGIFAESLAEAWEGLAGVSSAGDPDTAENAQLTNTSSMTGTARLLPTATVVRGVIVNVDAGASFAIGDLVAKTTGGSTLFENRGEVVNLSGIAANVVVDFRALETGPVIISANVLDEIAQVTAGWNSVSNPSAGVTGHDLENDPALRLRREEELSSRGVGQNLAIKEAVEAVEFVNQAFVFENNRDVEVDGRPAHSIEVLYDPEFGGQSSPSLDDIAQAIYDKKALGIETIGLSEGGAAIQSGTAIDGSGFPVTVNFSKVNVISIHVNYTLVTNSSFPADGDDQVEAAIIEAIDAMAIAEAIAPLQLMCHALTIPGIVDILGFETSDDGVIFTPGVLEIGNRRKATSDTSRIN